MPDHYGESVNGPLLDFMGPLHGTVLDLGCGVGTWAHLLRARGAQRLLGIEPSSDAVLARERYDRIYAEPVERLEDLPPLDVVIAADVLEHVADPWKVLRILRAATVPGGTLFISVPNVQCVKALAMLARGRFPYEDGGFWDRTHVHWFTRSSLAESLVANGWAPGPSRFVLGGGKRASLSRLSRGSLDPFLGHQVQMRAEAV